MHPIKVGSWHKVLIQTKFKDGTMIVDDGEPVRGSSQVTRNHFKIIHTQYINFSLAVYKMKKKKIFLDLMVGTR